MAGIPYYRFSPYMATDIELDETDDKTLVDLVWSAMVYMHSRQDDVLRLKEILKDWISDKNDALCSPWAPVEQGKLGEKVSTQKVKALNKLLEATTSLEELFTFLIEQQLGQIAFSTSLGQEDQVITHHIGTNKLPISVFTLDTGRLFHFSNLSFNHGNKGYGVSQGMTCDVR